MNYTGFLVTRKCIRIYDSKLRLLKTHTAATQNGLFLSVANASYLEAYNSKAYIGDSKGWHITPLGLTGRPLLVSAYNSDVVFYVKDESGSPNTLTMGIFASHNSHVKILNISNTTTYVMTCDPANSPSNSFILSTNQSSIIFDDISIDDKSTNDRVSIGCYHDSLISFNSRYACDITHTNGDCISAINSQVKMQGAIASIGTRTGFNSKNIIKADNSKIEIRSTTGDTAIGRTDNTGTVPIISCTNNSELFIQSFTDAHPVEIALQSFDNSADPTIYSLEFFDSKVRLVNCRLQTYALNAGIDCVNSDINFDSVTHIYDSSLKLQKLISLDNSRLRLAIEPNINTNMNGFQYELANNAYAIIADNKSNVIMDTVFADLVATGTNIGLLLLTNQSSALFNKVYKNNQLVNEFTKGVTVRKGSHFVWNTASSNPINSSKGVILGDDALGNATVSQRTRSLTAGAITVAPGVGDPIGDNGPTFIEYEACTAVGTPNP